MNVEKMIRKEIKNFVSYIPGKPIDEVKRMLGLKSIIKLASNENAFGFSNKIKNNLIKNLSTINIYPESSCFYLRQKLSKKFNIPDKNIIFGNGSDEIIELLGKVFLNKNDNIIVSEHAFIRYKMAGDLMGCKIKIVPMKNFTHDLDKMSSAINNQTKIIFIANPNNPTGTYNTKQEFERLLIKVKNKNIIVALDEAYLEFVDAKDYPDSLSLLSKYDNLIILRTFSKIYGLAGLRIGYGISSRNIIECLDRIRPPFNVNNLAQVAAITALEDNNFVKNTKKQILKNKIFLYKNLGESGFKYIKSQTNFVLIKVGKGKELFLKLLRKGIIVRAMDEYDFPEYIRVTIGTEVQMKRFVSELIKLK